MTSPVDTAAPAPRYSPLHAAHVAAGAAFTDFAGWQMPVRYSGDLAEHHAVRTAAGLFDLSHMAEVLVSGPEAAALLDHALAGTLSTIPVGRAKYSLLLDETGGVIDDLVVYRVGETHFLVVANASNHDPVLAALHERAQGFDATVTDDSDDTALVAAQGPASTAVLAAIGGLDAPGFAELGYYRGLAGTFQGTPVWIARTGYTGEDGFEVYLQPAAAEPFWNAALAAGTPLGLVPAGLACRDTLRLEAGMPLYGHELAIDVLPVQAGLGRVPDLAKSGFVGKAALELGTPPNARVLVGLVGEGRRAARAGYDVYAGDERVGTVTSGALSPTLGHPVALAYVDPAVAAPGTELTVDIRGSRLPYRTTTLPFYRRKKD